MDVVRCASCGEENPGRARFCLSCGTPIATSGAPPAREVRKTLTVLFADMVGFTALGERLDQESLRRVMDRFYAEMRGAIEGEGGTVAKFIGDAVMAVWGTPTVNEDDAVRGVRAAEAMRGALTQLNEDLERRWGVNIALRTGVNTGEVVVDPAKSADLLVGDTLNVAARLEQAAAPGEVLVGSETYRLVRDDARLEPVEPLELKGKVRPVAAFRLVDGTRRERRRDQRLHAPLVGRERELARLRAALDAATAASETRVVTLIGSPGVGKTRLVREFTASLKDSATVVGGHCEATGEGLTFLPVAEVVRSGAGIHEGDSAESAAHKLAAVLPEDDPARDRVLESALGLVGLGPPVSVEESFWAVRRFLEGLARLRRLVVLLDDVHWGQPTFLDLIEHLAAWGRGAPVLVVVMARPELREIRPSLTERNEAVTEVIGLGPLAPGDSRALVDRLLGEADLPPSLAERVLETTEGNPLFLGEMLRMLVDDGVLRRSGDQWVTEQSGGVAVPPTIHALLAARIERLSDAERSVVERAAVIGQQFYVGAVAALGEDGGATSVAEHLDRLRRKELVAPEGTLWEGEEVFRFHHVLVRDAAYRSLLKEARADLHERFAAWLAERAGEHEELIALHLERAHAYREQLGPLDEHGRAIAARAADCLHCAGRRALEREDLPAAANLLLRALYPLDAGDRARLGVLADLAEAQLSAGDTGAAEETVEELALRAESAGDAAVRALATAYACQLAILTGAGHLRETIALATEAADELERAGDRAAAAKAHHVTAQAHSLLGEIAAAEHALDRALVAARAAKDRRRVTSVLSGAPRAALWGPSPIVRASGRCLDVVRILRMTPGNRHVEAAALRCQAVLEAMRGRPDAARDIVATCRATLEELGLALELHELATYAGIVELLAGEPAAAEAHLHRAREGFAALGVESGAAQASALLARALVEQGRFHEAEEQTRLAERHGGDDLKTGLVWRGVRAEALARRGEHAEAERLAREAVALAEPTDALADKADSFMALATVLRACGRDEEGRDAATRAHALYAAKEHTAGAMRARAALGARRRPAAPGDGTAAALGDRPSERTPAATLGDRPVERLWDAYCRTFNAADWDGLRALVADDVELVDHRMLWPPVRGAGAFLDAQRSGAAVSPDMALRVERVVAADDEHAAVVLRFHARTHDGGGPLEGGFGVVTRVRDGRVDRVELFAPDDEERLLACYEALRGGRPRSPVPPSVHARAQQWAAAVSARRYEDVPDAPDCVVVDHRRHGAGEAAGPSVARDAIESVHAGAENVLFEVDVLAGQDDGTTIVDVSRTLVTGTGRHGGGRFEVSFLAVNVVARGLIRRSELYDPEDEEEALRRFDELCAEVHGDHRRPVAPRARERTERWARAASQERYDDIAQTADYAFVDHRHGGAGAPPPDGDDLDGLRSLHRAARDVRIATEPLAGLDDGHVDVCATLTTVTGESVDGGGRFEVTFGSVSAARDGATYRVEMVEAGDPLLMDRFDAACLDAFGATLSPHATAPIPPAVVALDLPAVLDAPPGARIELVAGAASRDRLLVAAHVEGAGWRLAARSQVETLPGLAALVERYHEVWGELGSAGWMDAVDQRDWAAARALLADDIEVVDHRALGWAPTHDADRMLEATRSLAQTSPDTRWRARVLEIAERDGRSVERVIVTLNGTLDGAPWEVSFGSVGVIEGGLRTRFEFFEPEDEEGMAAAFAALAGAAREYPAAS
ncbi:MAG TPA: adenylate/guanylate cyclase domain-containing protein [Solirubrobacteraceae bacterium]|jgi:class 3 adenylate cyclase/tetratricopeptide (TPR) repeat protein/ketosteroid isomerase-like protein